MALQQVRIGSAVDIFQYDDAAFASGIEATGPINAGVPVAGSDVLRLDDIGGGGGLGDVQGPGASTDNAAARFHLATGKIIQNSLVIISDTGLITAPGGAVLGGAVNRLLVNTAGILTLEGTGRVTVDKYISASGVKARGAKPATEILHGIANAWQFVDQAVAGNQETVEGTMKLPTQMDKTVAPIFKVGWSANGISPGVGEWQLSYRYMAPNDDTTAIAQDTITATGTASATSDGLVITSFTGMELPGASDQAMFFEIKRLSAVGSNDTIVDTLELHGMLFTHTRNKLGTAL